MCFERFFAADFLLCERNPVIFTVFRRNSVLPVEQRESKAVRLKFKISFPAVIRIQKLIIVVYSSVFNTMTKCKINTNFYTPSLCLMSFSHSPLYLKNLGPEIEHFLPYNSFARAVNDIVSPLYSTCLSSMTVAVILGFA